MSESPVTHSRRQHLGSVILRLFDGAHAWGHVTTTVGRYGSASESLMILPPDTSLARRRWVSAQRAMPPIALLGTATGGAAAVSVDVPTLIAFGAPALVFATILLVCWREASPATHHAAYLTAQTSALVSTVGGQAEVQRLRHIAHRLTVTEVAAKNGEIDPAAFEREWRAAYELVQRLELLGRVG